MKPFSLFVMIGLPAVVLGVPLGLYTLLTRGQRRSTREIREGATERGWQFRIDRWQGNPAAFRIDGRTRSGVPWILASGNSGTGDNGWSTTLLLRFPALGGEMDFELAPRSAKGPDPLLLARGVSHETGERVAVFSGAVSRAVDFFRSAPECPADFPAFDATYRVWRSLSVFDNPLSVLPSLGASSNGLRSRFILIPWWLGETLSVFSSKLACQGRRTGPQFPISWKSAKSCATECRRRPSQQQPRDWQIASSPESCD